MNPPVRYTHAAMTMKMTQMARSASAWLIALNVLVSSCTAMELCIGDDGHLAVEPAHAGQCHRAGDERDMGGCVDVPVGLEKVLRAAKDVRPDRELKGSVSEDLSGGLAARMSVDGCRASLLTHADTLRVPHALLAHWTIVLRI
jgi:hypothetical protein